MEVFLNKIDLFLEKFYKCQSEIDILKSDFCQIKKEIENKKNDNKELILKIYEIEGKIENLKVKKNNSDTFWGNIIDFLIKIVYVVVVSYILYQLGWESNLEISP